MGEEGFKRKLTAVLSADVVGYSRLMEEEDMTTVRNLREYQKLIAGFIAQYRGRVVDTPGDNLLAEFKSTVDAVQCAVEIQRALVERKAKISEGRQMAFPLPEKPSITVLPFTNMSSDAAQEYIGDGISENIITALSMGSAIFVIARNSTFTYKGRAVKAQEVAQKLCV